MLIKAFLRGNGRGLARYLLHNPDNDVAECHSLRHFMAEDLVNALIEIDATAKGTRCPKPIFSVSFNPPPGISVSDEAFEKAFEMFERRFHLEDQPRAVVFHEKPGERSGIYRRHAHVVYGRIYEKDGKLRAKDLGPYQVIIRYLSRDLYRELGIEPPAGYLDRDRRDPSNYTHKTWQQARRISEDPRNLKVLIRDLFLRSKDRESFEKNLAPHGLYLVRSDKKRFGLLHHSGEYLNLPHYSGLKTKDIRQKLGDEQSLRSIEETRALMKEPDKAAIRQKIQKKIEETRARQQEQLRAIRAKIDALKLRHRQERALLYSRQHAEWKAGERERADRLRRGIIGIFDRVTGTRTKVARQNAAERAEQKASHRAEKQALIDEHSSRRGALQAEMTVERQRQTTERRTLREELAAARLGEASGVARAQPARGDAPRLREAFDAAAPPQMGDPGYAARREAQREITRDRRRQGRGEGRSRERGEGDGGRDRGPEIER